MTTRFTNETSRKINLASASNDRIAKIIAEVTGIEIDEATAKSRSALIKLAKEHGHHWDGNVVDPAKKAAYGAAQHCDDDVANLMAAFVRSTNPETGKDYLDMAKLRAVAKTNEISIQKWMHCNEGQIRMNLGNVLRGRINRGEQVVIGDRTWNEGNVPTVKAKKAAKKPAKAKAAKKASKPKAAKPDLAKIGEAMTEIAA